MTWEVKSRESEILILRPHRRTWRENRSRGQTQLLCRGVYLLLLYISCVSLLLLLLRYNIVLGDLLYFHHALNYIYTSSSSCLYTRWTREERAIIFCTTYIGRNESSGQCRSLHRFKTIQCKPWSNSGTVTRSRI